MRISTLCLHRGRFYSGLLAPLLCTALFGQPASDAQEATLDEPIVGTVKSWENCEKVLATSGAPWQFQSYASLRIAQSYLMEKNAAAARSEYEKIAANAAYPEVHRREAEECVSEIDRMAKGLPARDVTASRAKVPAITTFAVEYFIAPQGDDANAGTREKPFATLEKARDTIRALRARGAFSGPVCVNLMPGEYLINRTFELNAADSGTETAPIVYRALKDSSAVLYGGKRLGGFARVTDPAILSRLPAGARRKVFQCHLKNAGITNYSPLTERGFGVQPPASTLEVFFNGMPMTLARWPNAGFVNGGRIIDPGSKAAGKPSVFEYLNQRAARWTNAEDGWLYGYFRHGWADRTLKIQSIDTTARQIACGPYDLGGENMKPVKWFNGSRIRYYAFNLLEELDQPGEWYLDRKTGILYFYPPSDPAKAVVEIGLLPVPMLTLDHVSHVRFEGLVFDLSQADCMSLEDCESCLVAGCTVKRFAGSGILIHGGHDDGILGCDLYSLGRGATEVTGGDRQSLTPARHFVENCRMYSFGRLDHTYVPGIQMDGVGIRATHNYFHDCPSSAIRFDGNDLIMEYNRVERAVLESEDQGAMETWGNPTFRGNVLRYNYFAFIGAGARMKGSAGRAGIRLDDAISGTLIYGNIFFHASQSFGAININGGRDNIIDNNIFAECETAITGGYNSHNERWQKVGKDPELIMSELYLKRYPELRRINEQPGLNSAWRNIFWKCDITFSTYVRSSARKFDSVANAEFNSNPGFVDAAKGDFRLKSDAKVLCIGFHPIPVEEIGLYRDVWRPSWPL